MAEGIAIDMDRIMSRSPSAPEARADAVAALSAAFPAHNRVIQSLMWLGSHVDGTDRFKHISSRKRLSFDRATGIVTGTVKMGTTSNNGDEVLADIGFV